MNDPKAGDGRPDNDAPNYDAMERDIRRSRESIGVSLSEIRRRLSLSHLKEQTMNRTVNRRDTGTHTGNTSSSSSRSSSMGDMVRGNPVPLAMVGIGLGWLLLSRTGYDRRIANSSAMRSIGDHAGSTARYARDTFYGAGESVRDAASGAYDRMTGGGDDQQHGTVTGGGAPIRSADMDRSSGGRSMGRRVQSATSGVWDMVEEHPLVAGVMGVALGAAIGASIPSSSYENALVGEYSDQITRQAKDMAHDALDRGTRAARAAADAAREQVVNAADDARERVAAAASEVKSATKDELNRPA